jgi:hypothetical protein
MFLYQQNSLRDFCVFGCAIMVQYAPKVVGVPSLKIIKNQTVIKKSLTPKPQGGGSTKITGQ